MRPSEFFENGITLTTQEELDACSDTLAPEHADQAQVLEGRPPQELHDDAVIACMEGLRTTLANPDLVEAARLRYQAVLDDFELLAPQS